MNLEYEGEEGGCIQGVFKLLEFRDGVALLEPTSFGKKKSLKPTVIEVESGRIKKGNLVLQF